jgi:hypothetical protein
LNSNSKTRIEDFKFLYSVDGLALIFENFFELNQTLLPNDNLFLMTVLQVYKSIKIIEVEKGLFQGYKQSYSTLFSDLGNFPVFSLTISPL